MIEICGLSKHFVASRGRIVEAVNDVSFQVEEGEIYGLLGPNGAGKTTLLRMLGTIITPSSGYCVVCGRRTDQAPEEIRKMIGFASGNTKLYGRLSGRELLRYFGQLHEMSRSSIDDRTEELVQLLNMSDFIDRRCDSYSTGQTQKVSIARVILHHPRVLILDEPTLGLDIMTCQSILDFIVDSSRNGLTVIFSTHYMTEAEMLCNRIGFLYGGRLMAEGTQEALYQQTGTGNLKEAFLAMVHEQDQEGVCG